MDSVCKGEFELKDGMKVTDLAGKKLALSNGGTVHAALRFSYYLYVKVKFAAFFYCTVLTLS